MQDVLPDAQKLVSQPPFPSLPQAMVQLLAAKILTITVHEAQDFLAGTARRPAVPSPPVAPLPGPAPTPAHKPRRVALGPAPVATPGVAEPAAALPGAGLTTFVLQRPKAGFRAVAQWLPTGTMRVLAGSTAGPASGSFSPAGQQLRLQLAAAGILRPHEGLLRFTQDYEFDSPNRAAEVVCGGSVNARIAWLAEADGQTLGSYLAGLASG